MQVSTAHESKGLVGSAGLRELSPDPKHEWACGSNLHLTQLDLHFSAVDGSS
jgi:hypothetical protein